MEMMIDMFTNAGGWLIVQLAYLVATLIVAATVVLLVAIPIVAHFYLIVASIFLPLTLAVWPFNKDWALSCINTMMGAVGSTVTVAIFSKFFLGSSGILAKGATTATAALEAGDKGLIMGAALGIIVVAGVVLLIAKSISGVVSSIFAGASLSVAERGASKAAAGAGAGAAKAMSAMASGIAKLAKLAK